MTEFFSLQDYFYFVFQHFFSNSYFQFSSKSFSYSFLFRKIHEMTVEGFRECIYVCFFENFDAASREFEVVFTKMYH